MSHTNIRILKEKHLSFEVEHEKFPRTGINNLRKFCQQLGYDDAKMHRVIGESIRNGNKSVYFEGWTIHFATVVDIRARLIAAGFVLEPHIGDMVGRVYLNEADIPANERKFYTELHKFMRKGE